MEENTESVTRERGKELTGMLIERSELIAKGWNYYCCACGGIDVVVADVVLGICVLEMGRRMRAREW